MFTPRRLISHSKRLIAGSLLMIVGLIYETSCETSAFAEIGNPPTFIGVFAGTMTLHDARERTIPLEVSLSLSDEIETVETSAGTVDRRVIDGSFVVDGEGGPYPFTKITYDTDLNILDLRYNRAASTSDTSPMSLRFNGKINEDGSISGRVTSGYYGVIGTFELKRTDRTFLAVESKYKGHWRSVISWNDNEVGYLHLEPTNGYTMNPPGLELGFTPGKIGGAEFNEVLQIGFNEISVDYLRGVLIARSVGPEGTETSLQCVILKAGDSLDCVFDSRFRGRVGKAIFERIPEDQIPAPPPARRPTPARHW